MEPQQESREWLPWWLRANAVCQLIVAVAPLTTLTLLALMGDFPNEAGSKDPFSQFFWWWLVFVPYVFVPALIVPFAMATFSNPTMSMSTASTLETWKSFFATVVFMTWLLASSDMWYYEGKVFTLLGAFLLLMLFYPALIYTWKVWNDGVREEIKQRQLQYDEEMNRRRAAQRRRPDADLSDPTETSPLLRQTSP